VYKKILPVMFIVAVLFLTACAAELVDGRATRDLVPSVPLVAGNLHTTVWENDNFILELDTSGPFIHVTDKSNGFVWSSTPNELTYEGLSRDWQLFAASLAVIDFINPAGGQSREMYDAERVQAPIFAPLDNGFAVSLHFPRADIRLRLEITLEDFGISASVPDEGIEYLSGNIISRIILLPFLGASYQDEIPGYIFLPDGSGAIMRFVHSRPFSNSWIGRIFGEDRGVVTSPPFMRLMGDFARVPMPQVYLPVFGVVHGENAFAAIIEGGTIFCDIEASPAGDRTNYFWVAPRFIYHELYWQPTGGNRGFVTPTPDRNIVNARVDYHFLSGENASYSGMASVYRSLLLERGELSQVSPQSGDIPIKIDAFMAEQESGFIGTNTMTMTTFSDIERWIAELNSVGMNNLTISMQGVERGGVSGRTTGNLNVERRLGGARGLRDLYNAASSAGTKLLIQTDFVVGFEHQIPIRCSVYALGGIFLTDTVHRPIFWDRRFMNFDSIENTVSQLDGRPAYLRSLSLDSIGNTLTSDFNTNGIIFRENALERTLNILGDLSNVTTNLLLEAPNAYAVRFADAIYNTPVTNSRQIFFQEVVPFYQMVFGGHVDMFSSTLNYRAHSHAEMLMLIDFNTFPSYVLTQESATQFARSNTVDIFSSRFDDWINIIAPQYHMINDVLRHVRGQYMLSRTEVAPNVFVTRYSGGGSVVVNYSREVFEYGGVMIYGESARFVGGL